MNTETNFDICPLGPEGHTYTARVDEGILNLHVVEPCPEPRACLPDSDYVVGDFGAVRVRYEGPPENHHHSYEGGPCDCDVAFHVERAGPEIVVLCGSTRFYDAFQRANYEQTMAGRIVLSIGFYPHASTEHGHGEGVGHDSAEKVALDELHKRKIDLADRVIVLNVGGYIGDSTRGEIAYAAAHGKPIEYLEPQHGPSIAEVFPSVEAVEA